LYARFAEPPSRRLFTLWLNVDTHDGFGHMWPRGWVFTNFFPTSGRQARQQANGG
jgi:hypothetical protein